MSNRYDYDIDVCDICEKSNTVMYDIIGGAICEDCKNKLSPCFIKYDECTADEIKEQLAYRKANQEQLKELSLKPIYEDVTNILYDEEKKVFVFVKETNTQDIIRSNPDIIGFDLIDFAVIHISYAYRNDADPMQHFFDISLRIYTNHKYAECAEVSLTDKPVPLHLAKDLDDDNCPPAAELKKYLSFSPEYAEELNYYRQLCEKAQSIKKRMTEIMGIPFDFRFDSIDGQTDFMI